MEFDFKSSINKEGYPLFTVDSSNLRGGADNTPVVEINEVRAASVNPFHEPIPFDMLF